MKRVFAVTGIVLASLMAGVLAYSVAAQVPVEAAGGRSISVPVGRLGDVIETLESNQQWESFSGYGVEFENRSRNWKESVAQRVERTGQVADRTGAFHEGLYVDYTSNRKGIAFMPPEARNLPRYLPLTSSYQEGVARRVLDLDSRLVLRLYQSQNYSATGVTSSEYFGPWGNDAYLSEFLLQGKTFTLGQDITHWLFPGEPLVPTAQALRRTAGVSLEGSIRGEEVLGIRLETWAVKEGVYDSHIIEVVWVSANSPYPLLIEGEFWHNYTEPDPKLWIGTIGRYQNSLMKYEAGQEPIPWAAAPAFRPFRPFDPALQRSPPGQLHPDDGSPPLPLPLARARESVENDLSLLGYRAWAATNPGSRLVGAGYGVRNGTLPPLYEWTLTFAAPGSDTAFRIRSASQGGPSAVVNAEQGPIPLRTPDYDVRLPASGMPGNLITIGDSIELWRAALGSGHENALPSKINWGYARFPTCEFPRTRDASKPTDPCMDSFWFGSPGYKLSIIEIGSVEGVASPTGSPLLVPTNARVDTTTIDLVRGHIYYRLARDHIWDYPAWSQSKLGATATPTQPPASSNAAVSVAAMSAAVATTSLLAILLGVYFAPLVREGVARVLFATPFYAKLRGDRLFDNALRESILHHIREDPGIDATRVHVAVGGGWSTVIYHLGVLEKNKLVTSLTEGRYKHFFPAGQIDFGKRGAIAVLRNGRTRAMYELLLQQPGLMRRDLAARLGVTVTGTTWHLERLQRAGLISADRIGRRVRYHPHPESLEPSSAPAQVALAIA